MGLAALQALFALFASASFAFGTFNRDDLWFAYTNSFMGVPALCFFKRLGSKDLNQSYNEDPLPTFSMILSLLVLFFGYLTRLIKLSEKAAAFSRSWIRTKPSHKIRGLRDSARKRVARPVPIILNGHWISAYVYLEALRTFLRALLDLYESMLGDILWLAFALAWGTENLVHTRAHNSDDTENTWGFGQLFPVLLLVLPLLSILETYYGRDISPCPDNESAASGGHVHIKHDVQLRLVRVGQWGPGTTSTDHTSVTALDGHSTITRTGTDIQTEEEQLDSIPPIMSLHSDSRVENHNTLLPNSGDEPSSGGTGPDQETKCYNFEWFWILILMQIASFLGVVVFTLAVSGQFLQTWQKLLTVLTLSLTLCFCYTVAFVALSLFHEALGKILETRLKFKRQMQRKVLRFMAWLSFPTFLGSVFLLWIW